MAHESAPASEKNGEKKEPLPENHLDSIRKPTEVWITAKEKGHEFLTYDPLTINSEMGEDTIEEAPLDKNHMPPPAVYCTEEVDDSNTDSTNETHDHVAEYGHCPHRSILLPDD